MCAMPVAMPVATDQEEEDKNVKCNQNHCANIIGKSQSLFQ
jgi:hypothetical protein